MEWLRSCYQLWSVTDCNVKRRNIGMAMKLLPTRGYTILAIKTKNQRNSDCHRGWLIYCTSTPFLCLLTEAIVSLEHRLRGIEAAPQPEHRLRGEKCERVKKEAPQPRGRCSLQHGAPVEEQTCFLVGNNFLAFPVSLLYIIRS